MLSPKNHNPLVALVPGIALSVLMACGTAGCDRVEQVSRERALIGTYVRVDVCRSGQMSEEIDAAFEEIWQRMDQIEQRMNAYDPQSEVGRINHAGGRPVEVAEDVYQVIQYGVMMADRTFGAFDMTVRPLIELWHQAQQSDRVPDEDTIHQVLERVGSRHIHLFETPPHYRIACEDCEIDLGGIAKGFAVDEAARILRRHGFSDFLINAGGDMYAGGRNCRGRTWRVAIQHPRRPEAWIDLMDLTGAAVATSGDYRQLYHIQGQTFSHIFNPLTGYPRVDAVSATVVAPTAMEADALSTALTVLPSDKGMALIDGLGGSYGALVIRNSGGSLAYDVSQRYPQWGRQKFQGANGQ